MYTQKNTSCIYIYIDHPHPHLYPHPHPHPDITVVEYQRGTREYQECSGRGLCDRDTGQCVCFDGFSSSNGQGDPGERPDCGYAKHFSGHLPEPGYASA